MHRLTLSSNSIFVPLFSGLVFLLFMLSSRFSPVTTEAGTALATVAKTFHTDLDAFVVACSKYEKQAIAFADGQIPYTQLKAQHLATRLAFKRAEYLLEYNDRLAVKKTLNGPPLLSLEPAVPEVSILEPVGLQVLDELLAEAPTPEDYEHITKLTAKLTRAAKQAAVYQKGLILTHRHVFEAAQLELIRVFSLGLTGFDTPGTLHAIPEARVVLQRLHTVIQAYEPLIKKQVPQFVDSLNRQFAHAHTVLQQTDDFEAFDRLRYLREVHQPLANTLWSIHSALGIETMEETTSVPFAIRLQDAPLFSTDFFNLDYYSGFDMHSPQAKSRQELGRLLFYDPVLSVNQERACASCHQPEKAFTDGIPTSMALDGTHHIMRNSPTLLNSVLAERYFYDLREPLLERQIKHVVMDKQEFGTDFIAIQDKLALSEEYVERFTAAYPQAGISNYSISNALAAYVATLTSFNSPFDQYVRHESATLDEAVTRGFNLFMGKAACGTCHFAPTFSGLVPPYFQESESEVLGVPMHPDSMYLDNDLGRINSGRPIDEVHFYAASFKTTTVRNVALTAPYMHNGVYPDLTSVVNFYNHGGGAGRGMDLPYQTLAPDSLGLVNHEIQDLIAFMESLTDTSRVGQRPAQLPAFEQKPEWNKRPIGGSY